MPPSPGQTSDEVDTQLHVSTGIQMECASSWELHGSTQIPGPGTDAAFDDSFLLAPVDYSSQPFSTSLTTFVPTYTSFDTCFLPPFLGMLPSTTLLVNHMFDSPFLNVNQGYLMYVESPKGTDSSLRRRQSPFLLSPRAPSGLIGQNFLLMNIRAYARTLVHDQHTPSFIHNTVLNPDVNYVLSSRTDGCVHQPEHLPVCKNIVRMYKDCTAHTKAFIWRSIDGELSRFMQLVSPLPKYKSLSLRWWATARLVVVWTVLGYSG
jgi:hypothetical protein